MKKKVVQARQGDVLVVKVKTLPKAAVAQGRNGRLILAQGEATGHHHAIADVNANFAVVEQTKERFLDIQKRVALTHEEHKKIELPSGYYKVVIQREYDGTYSRPVVD